MGYLILGIDTSNYTTSIALIDQDKRVIFDNRKLLNVKEGQRGLRQSEALFQHVYNMPILFKSIAGNSATEKIKYISVSGKPRPREDSYMPVFLAAKSYGQVLAATLECSYVEYSHQESHIEAAKWSSNMPEDDKFIGIHLSGGTTELLLVKKEKYEYSIELIGGTMDISAGQLLDRLGVKLGYSFPAGHFLDSLALKTDSSLKLPISISNTHFNLSGLETKAYQYLEKSYNKDLIVKGIMESIAKTLAIVINNAVNITNVNKVLCFGGVASSEYIRNYLLNFNYDRGISMFFGDKKYCTDNGVGTALLPLAFLKEQEQAI